ncbi:carbamoyltransferase HypF [Synergistales bacterium]|nr:carbamoyltransferase HypF [Synergistales bacterium]
MQRATILITGIVQGVGFRPFCARAARGLGLFGSARNTRLGVEVIVEGDEKSIDEYLRVVRDSPPPASVITNITQTRVTLSRPTFTDFSIIKSEASRGGATCVLIPSDLAVCDDCVSEMRDPNNRRFRYPFINCTNCGPRYTIIQGLPYDRPLTTMSDFPMCPECEREYKTPSDRRFHAQPNACPVCGPKLWLASSNGDMTREGEDAVQGAIEALEAGKIVAVKGLGGYHIACLVQDAPIGELRERKRRASKPFAIMARDVDSAMNISEISPEAERLLKSIQRPIVLCPLKKGARVPSLLAPGQLRIGIMLPYTPLHHLLLENFDSLVMTSANVSDSPIVSTEKEAFSALSGIADFFLCHNRRIHSAIDDSVLIPPTDAHKQIFLRRARGFVPNPTNFPSAAPDILAAGAQMKSTYALSRNGVLFPGQYLGDLGELLTASYYKSSLAHFLELYKINPKIMAFDKHPGYTARTLAAEFLSPDVIPCPVQHHHAHMAAVLFENDKSTPAIGVIFDGTGYGDDGTIWGGEFLCGDAKSYKRVGSLLPFRLLGGENAIREPWRIALSMLSETFGEEAKDIAPRVFPAYSAKIESVLSGAAVAPVTTSCGRLFDGFAALTGLCETASYDAQAAMTLENAALCAAQAPTLSALPFSIEDKNDFLTLDWRGAVKTAVSLLFSHESVTIMAYAFHTGLAHAIFEACDILREKTGCASVALSGGVWQNACLLALAARELESGGFNVLTHVNLSPSDECVSVGQAVVAAHAKRVGKE